jgi:hypothetical protein
MAGHQRLVSRSTPAANQRKARHQDPIARCRRRNLSEYQAPERDTLMIREISKGPAWLIRGWKRQAARPSQWEQIRPVLDLGIREIFQQDLVMLPVP